VRGVREGAAAFRDQAAAELRGEPGPLDDDEPYEDDAEGDDMYGMHALRDTDEGGEMFGMHALRDTDEEEADGDERGRERAAERPRVRPRFDPYAGE